MGSVALSLNQQIALRFSGLLKQAGALKCMPSQSKHSSTMASSCSDMTSLSRRSHIEKNTPSGELDSELIFIDTNLMYMTVYRRTQPVEVIGMIARKTLIGCHRNGAGGHSWHSADSSPNSGLSIVHLSKPVSALEGTC